MEKQIHKPRNSEHREDSPDKLGESEQKPEVSHISQDEPDVDAVGPPTAEATSTGPSIETPPIRSTPANSLASPLVFQIDPSLVNAQIEFNTHKDGKDEKTLLTVTVVDFQRVVAARFSGRVGEFKDHTSSGSINLRVLNASLKSSLKRGAVTIRIDPEGNETWRFSFFLLLTFDDNSTLQAEGFQLGLSEPGGDYSPMQTMGIGGIR